MTQITAEAPTGWVLVVDDDPIAREVVRGHLAPLGIEVRDVGSATAALETLVGDDLPGVIVTDLMMPTMDGFAFCAQLREDPRLQHLPVLCVSAAGDRANRLRALEAGADDLLAKPVDDVELTARVRSMDRLRRLRVDDAWRREIDAVIDAVGEGLIVTDHDGHVLRSNASGRRLLGLRADSQPGFDLFGHLADTLVPSDETWSTAREGATVAVHRSSTDGRFIELAGVPVRVAGSPPAIIIAARDVTDRVRAEDLSDLILSSVGHKLRTPLTGLVSGLELLGMQDLPADVAPLVGVTQRSARRLADALVRLLHAAATIQEGAAERPLHLGPDTTASSLATELGIELDGFAVDVNVTDPIAVDAQALAVAIAEYTENARSRRAARATVDIASTAGGLRMVVEDDGPGFAAALESVVFTPFFQSDETGQDDGMGLGLPLVRTLVERAGGSVSARSRPGEATRFTVELPALEVPA